jgi:hypothetical protein
VAYNILSSPPPSRSGEWGWSYEALQIKLCTETSDSECCSVLQSVNKTEGLAMLFLASQLFVQTLKNYNRLLCRKLKKKETLSISLESAVQVWSRTVKLTASLLSCLRETHRLCAFCKLLCRFYLQIPPPTTLENLPLMYYVWNFIHEWNFTQHPGNWKMADVIGHIYIQAKTEKYFLWERNIYIEWTSQLSRFRIDGPKTMYLCKHSNSSARENLAVQWLIYSFA